MVELSKRNAAEAGVAEKATFVEGDMYQADISKANVLALFLLPSNMLQLRQKFLALQAGTRIVSNTFGIEGWTPDETVMIEGGCSAWCTALLWIVPASISATISARSEGFMAISSTERTPLSGSEKARRTSFVTQLAHSLGRPEIRAAVSKNSATERSDTSTPAS
jgi:hypothetical protein